MLIFFLAISLITAIAGFGYFYWQKNVRAEIVEGAEISWAHFQKTEPDFVDGLTREQFFKIYDRVHFPRFPGYALAAIVSFFAALPIVFVLLTMLLWGAEVTGIIPQPVDVADQILIRDGELLFFKNAPPEAALYYIRDLAGFYYFFGVLMSWLLIVFLFTKRFHARRPGYLRDEIIRTREELKSNDSGNKRAPDEKEEGSDEVSA